MFEVPNNSEDWWSLLEHNWNSVYTITTTFNKLDNDSEIEFVNFKDNRDKRIVVYMEDAYDNITTNKQYIAGIYVFNVLLNSCGVLNEKN